MSLFNSKTFSFTCLHSFLLSTTLCNNNVGPITLEPLYDVIVTMVMCVLRSNVWQGHDTITTTGSLVVKGLTKTFVVHVCIVGDYSTHLRRIGITV